MRYVCIFPAYHRCSQPKPMHYEIYALLAHALWDNQLYQAEWQRGTRAPAPVSFSHGVRVSFLAKGHCLDSSMHSPLFSHSWLWCIWVPCASSRQVFKLFDQPAAWSWTAVCVLFFYGLNFTTEPSEPSFSPQLCWNLVIPRRKCDTRASVMEPMRRCTIWWFALRALLVLCYFTLCIVLLRFCLLCSLIGR